MSTRVGSIDCGTNSIRLLIADIDPRSGRLTDVVRRMEIVRLGHGVDKTGVLAPDALARTLAMTREYAQQCREYAVHDIRFVATSASRDASNADEFVTGVREAFGDLDVAPEVISGVEEARLSFLGATGDLVAAGMEVRSSSSTSAAGRPSSSVARARSRRPHRLTWAVSG